MEGSIVKLELLNVVLSSIGMHSKHIVLYILLLIYTLIETGAKKCKLVKLHFYVDVNLKLLYLELASL